MSKLKSMFVVTAVGLLSACSPVKSDGPQQVSRPRANTLSLSTNMFPMSMDGHYWVHAPVNGNEAKFLLDTGATAVAITKSEAERLHLTPTSPEEYHMTTASGDTDVRKVVIEELQVGRCTLTEVPALIVEEGLDVNLLGMSALSRLKKVEIGGGEMRVWCNKPPIQSLSRSFPRAGL